MAVEYYQNFCDDYIANYHSLKLSYASHIRNLIQPISAYSLTATRDDFSVTLDELSESLGREAEMFLNKHLTDQQTIYMFVSHCAWQTKSIMNRHRKLWKGFSRDFPQEGCFMYGNEYCFECDNQIRYAGVIAIDISKISFALNYCRKIRSCFVFCSTRKNIDSYGEMRSLFSNAFPIYKGCESGSIDWISLCLGICPSGDILLASGGLFDDREAYVDIIANNSFFTKAAGQSSPCDF